MSQQAAANGAGPTEPHAVPETALSALVTERPEVAVGAAFVGGWLVARILKRLGS